MIVYIEGMLYTVAIFCDGCDEMPTNFGKWKLDDRRNIDQWDYVSASEALDNVEHHYCQRCKYKHVSYYKKRGLTYA